MTNVDRKRLAVEYCNSVIRSTREDGSDAADRLITLTLHDPESAWDVAMQVLEICPGENAASIIGAGVIEDLFHHYPDAFIIRAIERAEGDPRLARALKYADIRKGEIPQQLFEQLERAQKR